MVLTNSLISCSFYNPTIACELIITLYLADLEIEAQLMCQTFRQDFIVVMKGTWVYDYPGIEMHEKVHQ
jgi:hypothetical protein